MENRDVRIRITIAGSYAYYPLLRMLFAKYQIANCPQTVSKTLTK